MAEIEIGMDSVIEIKKEIPTTEIDGEVGMLNVETGKYYGLDETGSRIWRIIENPIKVSEIIETLQKEYDVDADTCKNDVFELLEKLLSEKLINVR